MVIAALFCFSCGGNAPPAPSKPPPAPVEPAPAPSAEPPAPAEVEPAPESLPEPEPVEDPEPAPPKPKPPPEPTCADYGKSRCQVTEGCEWHSVRKCLEQEKPRTLEP